MKNRVANQRPKTLAKSVTIGAVSGEVLEEEYDLYGKDKKKQLGTNTNNSKLAFAKPNQGKRNANGDKKMRCSTS